MKKQHVQLHERYFVRHNGEQLIGELVVKRPKHFELYIGNGESIRRATARAFSKHIDGCILRGCDCQAMLDSAESYPTKMQEHNA